MSHSWRKKTLIVLLSICLILVALPAPASADEVCFIAINDQLLELTSMPAFVGSSIYVPYWIFESFHIYYTFFSSDNTAMVYTEAKQFYFEMGSGNTYDNDNTPYSAQAIFRNGQVYLPAKFICDQFGLSYSFISGMGYGDIVRISDSSVVLGDKEFLSAASILMETYYNAYLGLSTESSPGPDSNNTTGQEPDRRNADVLLCFEGLPSETILEALAGHGAKACFLLTAEDIEASPDTVRQLVASDHSIGILCDDDPELSYQHAAALLFDAARITPLLAAAASDDDTACRAMASSNNLAFLSCDVDVSQDSTKRLSAPAVTSQISFWEDTVSIRLTCNETMEEILPDILQYLTQNRFGIRAVRETDTAT